MIIACDLDSELSVVSKTWQSPDSRVVRGATLTTYEGQPCRLTGSFEKEEVALQFT